jgi:hypothetical protein
MPELATLPHYIRHEQGLILTNAFFVQLHLFLLYVINNYERPTVSLVSA